MKRIRSLATLQTLHGLGFLALVVVSGIAGTAGLMLNERWAGEARRLERLQQAAQEARGDLYRQTKEIFDFHFLGDPGAAAEYRGYAGGIDRRLAELAALADGADEEAAIATLAAAYRQARARADALMARPAGAIAAAERLSLFDTEFEGAGLATVEAALDSADRVFGLAQDRLERRVSRTARLALVVLVVPVGLAAALLWLARGFLARAFIAPLQAVLSATAAFGAGRLDHRVAEDGAAEMVELQRAINRMADAAARNRAELVRAEKQAALGALVPVIAHNIRNPLASIRASAQLLTMPEPPTGAVESARTVIAAVDRLNNWLTALLGYLHPQKAHRKATALTDCADHALALLAPRLAEKSLTVERRGWSAPRTAALDADLVEQAIYGLLGNAIEASPPGAALVLAADAADGACRLAIEDRGPGMPFAPSPHGPFPGPSTKTYGSGLGIPFAYKIAELHDGALAFEPAPGGGTRVTLSLPAAQGGGP